MARLFRIALWAAAALSLTLLITTTARADGSAGPVYYANRDMATAVSECDAGQVCATISEASGDQVKVLIGASGHCNAYIMTFMRYTKEQLVAVWATPTDRNPDQPASMMGGIKCGAFRNTHMTIDVAIDMGVFQNTNGKVFVLFFGGSTTPPSPSPTPAPVSAPAPSPVSSPMPTSSRAPKRSSPRR